MLLEDIHLSSDKLVYHGTTEKFDKLNFDKIGSGMKDEKGGWGMYFSESEEVASQYTTVDNPIIKKYYIPSGKYFDLDDGLDDGFARELLELLKYQKNVDIKEFETDILEYIYDTTNEQVYQWLSHELGSSKNASLFLADNFSYKGNTFKDKTSSNIKNFVLFSPKGIKETYDENFKKSVDILKTL